MKDGIIIKGIGGFYYVRTETGDIYECKARGIFRKEKITPAIGDKVKISINGEKGHIEEIEPRSTYMIRPPVANVDTLVLVAATASPAPSLFLLDKMTVNAEMRGIEPVICLNKIDLADGKYIKDIYKKAGYNVFEVSVYENKGIDELAEYIKGRISAFAGLSGVGKSSLLNCITGSSMETGSVSDKISRGKHTTRHVELMELAGGGSVLDTPGFSSLEITGIEPEELEQYFPEIKRHIGCRFRGCAHIAEPDCGVIAAVENGDIAKERYESYCELYRQLKAAKQQEYRK